MAVAFFQRKLEREEAAEQGLPLIQASEKIAGSLDEVAPELRRTLPLSENRSIAGTAPIAGTRQV